MITVNYSELRKALLLRLRRIGFYGIISSIILLLSSYVMTGDLDPFLSHIEDIIVLRAFSIAGIAISFLIILKGPNVVEMKKGLFRINQDTIKIAKTFEKIMEGEWE